MHSTVFAVKLLLYLPFTQQTVFFEGLGVTPSMVRFSKQSWSAYHMARQYKLVPGRQRKTYMYAVLDEVTVLKVKQWPHKAMVHTFTVYTGTQYPISLVS